MVRFMSSRLSTLSSFLDGSYWQLGLISLAFWDSRVPVALGYMAALMIGVLKGTTWVSVVATGGLCIALVPLGIQILREAPSPSGRAVLGWGLTMIALLAALYFLGQAG